MAASVAPDDARRAGARRPALLAPVDSLLTRLPTSARLAALVTLLLIPAAFVNVAYFRTISGQVDSSLAERDGVRVLRPALTAMATTVAGRTPDLAAVESAVTDEPGLASTRSGGPSRRPTAPWGRRAGTPLRSPLPARRW
jgi:hypothetical protein